MPVIPASQLKEFVTNTLLNVRNGIQAAIDDGLVCLVPKTIDFNVTVVADDELLVKVSKGASAPDGEVVETTIIPAEKEVAVSKKAAVRKGKTTGTEDTTGTEEGNEQTSSKDAGEQLGEESGVARATGSKEDNQTDQQQSADSESVRQQQTFGRSSITEVTYTRS